MATKLHTPEDVDAFARALAPLGVMVTAAVLHNGGATIEIARCQRRDMGSQYYGPPVYHADRLDADRRRATITGDGEPVGGKPAKDLAAAVAAALAAIAASDSTPAIEVAA